MEVALRRKHERAIQYDSMADQEFLFRKMLSPFMKAEWIPQLDLSAVDRNRKLRVMLCLAGKEPAKNHPEMKVKTLRQIEQIAFSPTSKRILPVQDAIKVLPQNYGPCAAMEGLGHL